MKKSDQQEIMDLGTYSKEEYEHCLKQLDRIGKYLGGDSASFGSIDFTPSSILDVGCGGGFFTEKLKRKFPNATVLGIDPTQEAIEFAKQHCNADFKQMWLQDMPSKSFDVVVATLVTHHLNDKDLIEFLKEAQRVAKRKVIINDLHRHFIAWLTFTIISPLFFKNRLIQHDGPLSIRRAFVKTDWQYYLKEANIKNYSLKWHWPFRWILTF